MRTLREWAHRLLGTLTLNRRDRELEEELRAHLDLAADEAQRRGRTREDAVRAARLRAGGVSQAMEALRDQRGLPTVDALTRDLRFSVRMLIKNRWVTLAAVSALALGIAATTTVFTIINATLLRDLPFDEPDRIVAIGARMGNARSLTAGLSYLDFQDWRTSVQTFAGLGAMRETTMNVSDEGVGPERFIGAYISNDAFALLKQQPLLGRDFVPDDDRRGAIPVVILGHALWRTRYSSDPNVLGRTIRVNGVPSVVIGVMPDGFSFPVRSRLWQPLGLLSEKTLASRDARDLSGFGRLAPHVTIDQAAADLRAIGEALAQQYPDTNRDVTPLVAGYADRAVGGRGRSTLPALMGVIAIVLLMACANVANLLLAQASVRSHEISIRMAIGAGRAQIVRQLLIESLLLAVLAGVAGWGLSLTATRAISSALGGNEIGLPYWIHFTMDERVFAFAVGVSLATALLFGLVPTMQTLKAGIANRLVETGRTTAGTVRSRRWVHGLVVFQLALTPILLTGGALMMRSIVAQYEMDAGVETKRIMWARLDLPDATYPAAEDRARFYQRLDARLAAVPGLVAGMISHAPFGGGMGRNLWRDDETVRREPRRPRVLVVTSGPRYFDAFRTRILRGSELPLHDTSDAPVIVNEWLAATVFPGEDPIGRRIRLTVPNGTSPGPEWFTIAGIAPNIRQSSTEDASGRDGVVYVSYASNPLPRAAIVARSDADPSAAAALLREQVRAVDPNLPLFEVATLDDLLAASDERVGLRVFGTMFVVFACVALLLATIGLYAVTAYAAAQRTREIGIRVALGAQATQIWWLVTRSAAWQLGLGLSIGMAGAASLRGLLQSVLVGTRAADPLTFLAVAALLIVVSFCACLFPARRAVRLDPAAVLRSE